MYIVIAELPTGNEIVDRTKYEDAAFFLAKEYEFVYKCKVSVTYIMS